MSSPRKLVYGKRPHLVILWETKLHTKKLHSYRNLPPCVLEASKTSLHKSRYLPRQAVVCSVWFDKNFLDLVIPSVPLADQYHPGITVRNFGKTPNTTICTLRSFRMDTHSQYSMFCRCGNILKVILGMVLFSTPQKCQSLISTGPY